MEKENPSSRPTGVSNPYSSKKETPSLPLYLPKTPRELFLAHLPSSVSQLDKETLTEKQELTSNISSNNADNDVPWAHRLLSSQVPMFAEIRTISEYQNIMQPTQGQFYRLTGKLVHKTVHSPTCISLVLEDPLQALPQASRKRRVSFPLTGQRSVTCKTPASVESSTPKYLGGKAPASIIRRKSLLRKTPQLAVPTVTTPASPLDPLIDALKGRVWVMVRHIPLNNITIGDLVMVLGSTQVIDRDNAVLSLAKEEDEVVREVQSRGLERTCFLQARIVRSAVGTDMKLYQQALMARRAYLESVNVNS